MTDSLIRDLARLRTQAPPLAVNASIAATGLVDGYVIRPSPLGQLFVAFTATGVSAVDLAATAEEFEARYLETQRRQAVPVRIAPERIARHLDRAIATGRPGPMPVDLSRLTDFQQQVLLKTAEIPSGEVRPYGWIAKEIGKPSAVRAVGSALARNPVPVVIPCHRVVRSDGRFGNYSLGDPSNKRLLLSAEGLDVEGYEDLASRGIRYTGSDTTHVFCLPTCRPARSITDPHRVDFHSAEEALDAGYRPCKVCRPTPAAA